MLVVGGRSDSTVQKPKSGRSRIIADITNPNSILAVPSFGRVGLEEQDYDFEDFVVFIPPECPITDSTLLGSARRKKKNPLTRKASHDWNYARRVSASRLLHGFTLRELPKACLSSYLHFFLHHCLNRSTIILLVFLCVACIVFLSASRVCRLSSTFRYTHQNGVYLRFHEANALWPLWRAHQ